MPVTPREAQQYADYLPEGICLCCATQEQLDAAVAAGRAGRARPARRTGLEPLDLPSSLPPVQG